MIDELERVQPHSLEAERSVLGAILMHADEAWTSVAGELVAEDFFRDAHQCIFRTMHRLAAKQSAIDALTVRESLTASNEIERIGGPAFLYGLADGIPRSTNVEHYARIVKEKAQLRLLIAVATRLQAEAYEASEDASTVIDRFEQSVFAVRRGDHGTGFTSLRDIIPTVLEQIEAWHAAHGISGVVTGFRDLDALTAGLQPGNLILLAARPAMGKSALAMNIAQYVAAHGQSVGIFSLEMSELELAMRAVTASAGIDGHRLRTGHIWESEWSRLAAAMASLSELKIYIDESPFINAFEMRSRARRLKARDGLDLLVVDYTQLMQAEETNRRDNRTVELSAITRALKGLAKDLKIPVLALSQLSRRVEERSDKHPVLSDLRESGSLEQDADVVMFLYRESIYGETPENEHLAELGIAKHRNGPTGTVRLGWVPQQTRFVNLSDLPSR